MSHKYFINVSSTFHCMCGFSRHGISLQYATVWNILQEQFWFSTYTCYCFEFKHSMHSCDQNWKLWMHLWILYLWEWECWANYSLVYCFWSNVWLQLDKRVSYHINKLKMDKDFPNEIPVGFLGFSLAQIRRKKNMWVYCHATDPNFWPRP